MTTFFLDQNPYCNKDRLATIILRRLGTSRIAAWKLGAKIGFEIKMLRMCFVSVVWPSFIASCYDVTEGNCCFCFTMAALQNSGYSFV
ncbi:hypothetical protein [Herbaspirillum sp. Sphag1AN]|uniref:hypothetical protein n=1 Tax=Herbaspirillum sp. Sphag1AN TaxID=2587030 RepID=UPI00160D0E0F|nr:hypothetical protein [Herbaspirillum sp. Sphag1AN]